LKGRIFHLRYRCTLNPWYTLLQGCKELQRINKRKKKKEKRIKKKEKRKRKKKKTNRNKKIKLQQKKKQKEKPFVSLLLASPRFI
jgi:hypothetical protein